MIEELIAFAHLPLDELLKKVSDFAQGEVVFSTSLSWEDQVITDSIFRQDLPIRVFTLDTGRLFPETYLTLNATRERYHKNIEVFFPQTEAVQQLVTQKGASSFYESLGNRKECCFIRKVEPLNRALENASIWITGLRAEHSENRQQTEMIQWDESRQLIKLNPLINWDLNQLLNHIKNYNIPYNTLQDRGFVSIGCQPCTRAIKEGEAFRSGRWWWEDQSKKECGLHA